MSYTSNTSDVRRFAVVDMREGEVGVFRPPEEPLPYGMSDDSQEPYVSIVAPNIDKITARTFDVSTFGGERARRGLLAFLASVGGALVIIGLVVAAQTIMTALGIE